MNKSLKQICKKFFAITLAMAIIFCVNVPAMAAVSPKSVEANAGQVVTLKYTYSGIAGINGTFKYSNPSVISNVKFNISGLNMGKYNDKTKTLAFFGTEPVKCTITLTVTVSKKAKLGDNCTINFEYETTKDGNMPSVPNYKYDKVTIKVVEKLDKTELNSLIKKAEGLKKSVYTSETWAVLETALKNAKSVLKSAKTQAELNAAVKELNKAIKGLEKLPDYTELEKQIKIAESLNKADYTKKTWSALEDALANAKKAKSFKKQSEIDAAAKALRNAIANLVSIYEGKLNFDELNKQIGIAEGLKAKDYAKKGWAEMQNALATARKMRNSKMQPEIDAAATELKDAIAALTKMDYSALSDSLDAISDFIKDNKFLNLWDDSQKLINDAKDALTSRDQKTVDSFAQKIAELLTNLKKAINDAAGLESVVVEKPVPVEPTDDYCNIKMHTVWIVLFWISFAINIALGALIAMYYLSKKKSTSDDTPLVDYDITDDIE
jgi:tetratricopeptide (TPR) repeat protein